jgi:hypothetical protein
MKREKKAFERITYSLTAGEVIALVMKHAKHEASGGLLPNPLHVSFDDKGNLTVIYEYPMHEPVSGLGLAFSDVPIK